MISDVTPYLALRTSLAFLYSSSVQGNPSISVFGRSPSSCRRYANLVTAGLEVLSISGSNCSQNLFQSSESPLDLLISNLGNLAVFCSSFQLCSRISSRCKSYLLCRFCFSSSSCRILNCLSFSRASMSSLFLASLSSWIFCKRSSTASDERS